jgi:4-amino-4-deoxy-L-arabinose transferase-like glycosyltransferase
MSSFEEATQRFVNSLDDGLGLKILRAILFTCLVIGIFGGYAYSRFRGLDTPEAMEYAQLGRNLASGVGFTTRCIRPLDIRCIEKHSGGAPSADAMPDIRNAPAYAALLAGGFRLAGMETESPEPFRIFSPELKVIVPTGIILSMLTALLVYLTAKRLFGGSIAFISVFAYVCTDAVLANSVSGRPVSLLAAIASASVYFAVVFVQAKVEGVSFSRWLIPFAASAGLAGLGVLTGYTMLVFVPVLATFVSLSFVRGRIFAWMLFACISLAVVAPWCLRNHKLTGSILGSAPYAALHDTILYEGDAVDRSIQAGPGNVLISRALKAKLASRLVNVWENDLQALGSGLAICFFLVSFFHVFDRREVNALRWCIGLGLVMTTITVAMGDRDMATRLSVFLPFVVIYGAAFFVATTDRIFIEDEWKTVFSGLFVFIVALPAVVNGFALPAQSPYPPYYPPFVSYTSAMLEDDEVMCSDIPWATAWYGNRSSVLLPSTTDEFILLHAEWHNFSGLYITTETSGNSYAGSLADGLYQSWWPVVNRRVPDGFPLRHGISLPPDGHDQLFLTDKIRWPEEEQSELAEDVTDEVRVREETP